MIWYGAVSVNKTGGKDPGSHRQTATDSRKQASSESTNYKYERKKVLTSSRTREKGQISLFFICVRGWLTARKPGDYLLQDASLLFRLASLRFVLRLMRTRFAIVTFAPFVRVRRGCVGVYRYCCLSHMPSLTPCSVQCIDRPP